MKSMVKILVISLSLLLFTTFVFASGQQESEKKPVIIKMGDNLPDRTVGLGAVEEAVNTEFMKLHPEVEFEVESYQDQPYQQKIKIYATAGQLPDIMKYWSISTLLKPLVDSNLVEPLDMDDFSSHPWMNGALEENIYDGVLYGIPLTADFWVVYYNQSILDEVGLDVPVTFDDMKSAASKLSAAGYIPAVTDGKDGWPLSLCFDSIFWRVTNDYSLMGEALEGRKSFTDPEFVKAAELYQDIFYKSGIFGDDLVTCDYGTARNLFGQQRAAMYFMGAWEMGLASDQNFSDDFRKNVRAARFPVISGHEDQLDNLVAWYGGNYIVKSGSEHKELALEYIKLFADIYAEIMWDLQAGFPAQSVTPNDEDNQLAKDLLNISSSALMTSGTTAADKLDSAFNETHHNLTKELAAGLISPIEFCSSLDEALKKALK